jgi:hypothetical protein
MNAQRVEDCIDPVLPPSLVVRGSSSLPVYVSMSKLGERHIYIQDVNLIPPESSEQDGTYVTTSV